MSNTITVTKILEVYARIEKTRTLGQIVTTERLRRDYGVERLAIWETLQIILGHEEVTETMDYVMKLAKREAEKKAQFETEDGINKKQTRAQLLSQLTEIQNQPQNQNRDIMTIAGMMDDEQLKAHISVQSRITAKASA